MERPLIFDDVSHFPKPSHSFLTHVKGNACLIGTTTASLAEIRFTCKSGQSQAGVCGICETLKLSGQQLQALRETNEARWGGEGE